MPYSDLMTAPMRRELTEAGLRELRTPADVDSFMAEGKDGTALVAVNSICGCSAGCMRPALVRALAHEIRPALLATVFAGLDVEATERARSYIRGHAPSSPSMALFKDGELVFMLERHHIQGRHPRMIADDVIAAFDRHCGAAAGT
ncbi:MAG: BrxA/BrxB family bacilliredoxin [Longimicrobiales bacterium]